LVHIICWERTHKQKWDWEYDGKFLPIFDGRDFIVALEETRAKFFQMTEANVKAFESSWVHLLANGLKAV